MDLKRHYFLAEIAVFFIVLGCFVMPSLLVSQVSSDTFISWRFPLNQLVLTLFSVFILLIHFRKTSLSVLLSSFDYTGRWILLSGRAFLVFGILTVNSVLFQLLEVLLKAPVPQMKVQLPSGVFPWIFCVLTFASGSILEENIFRIYIPGFFSRIGERFSWKKQILIICELCSALLFAFCHRYLGLLAVINAFIAHLVLRYSFKKTGNPLANYIAHFSYNMLNVLLLGLIE